MQHQEVRSLSSEELACQARAGSEECFAELVRRHSDSIFRFLNRRVSSSQDAEDLSQETFARAHLKLAQYQPRYRFTTWLFTIAWRLACSFYRRQGAVQEVPVEAVETMAEAEPVAAAADGANLWDAVAEILPASQYEVIWYRYGEGMSVAEIAGRTGRTQVHVKVLLHRARLKLVRYRSRLLGE